MPSEPLQCKEVFALLSEYLDLELPPEACQEIAGHLNACPPCIDFAESLRSTVDLCRSYRPAEMPKPMAAGARQRVMAAYREMLAQTSPESR